MPTILIAEHEPDLLDLIAYSLRRAGYRIVLATDGRTALHAVRREQPDLIVIDLGIPGLDWPDWLEALRRESSVPLVALHDGSSESEIVQVLEAGADAYVGKPVALGELRARVAAVLRRVAPAARVRHMKAPRLEVGEFVLDPVLHEATHRNRVLRLSPTEFRLLHTFLLHPRQVLTPATFLRHVWGDPAEDTPAAREMLRVTISRLRRKIDSDERVASNMIQTVRGLGYAFHPTKAEPRSTPDESEPQPDRC